jgi:hypothetical protein
VIGAERAVKEELAIVEVWEIAVALATVEGQVIEVARVNSAAAAGPVEAMPEAEAVPLKASIAAGVPPEAPASVAAPVAAALVVVEGHEVEGAAEDGAGKEVSSVECQVASEISLDTRPSTLVSHLMEEACSFSAKLTNAKEPFFLRPDICWVRRCYFSSPWEIASRQPWRKKLLLAQRRLSKQR